MAWTGDKWGRLLDAIRFRRRDYQLTFGPIHGQNVLMHLAEFCRANNSCYEIDARTHARMDGRRDVWLLIQRYLKLSSEQLAEIYSGRNFQQTEGDPHA